MSKLWQVWPLSSSVTQTVTGALAPRAWVKFGVQSTVQPVKVIPAGTTGAEQVCVSATPGSVNVTV